MTKIAAALPAIAGLSTPAALGIGAALSAGAGILDQYGQKQHADRQEAANRRWLDYQNRRADEFERQDEERRMRASQELDTNLDASGIDTRQEVIDAETARLSENMGANLPDIPDAITGTGQEAGTSRVFDDAMARSLGEATQEARERIKAMARTMAYGGGSQYGMGMTDMLRNQQTGTVLGGINQNRIGDMGVLRRYQQVEPEILQYEPSPLVPIMNAAGSFFLGGGPEGLADMLASGAAGAGAGAAGAGAGGTTVATRGAGQMLTPTGGANPFGRTPFSFMSPGAGYGY